MTRVEELTGRLIEGDASAAERQELRELIDRDADARAVHVGLLRTETLLRGRRGPDVTAAVMDRLGAPAPARARAPRRARWWWIPLSLGFGGLAFAWLGGWLRPAARRPARPVAVSSALERLRQRPALPALGGEASVPALTPAAGREPMLSTSFDFEEGDEPALVNGRVVSDGCPPGSRGCALGGMNFGGPESNTVTLERWKPFLATWGRTRTLSFDYWIGGERAELWVQLWNEDKYQNYHFELRHPAQRQWTHAEIRLRDFVGNVRPAQVPDDGDRIMDMVVAGGRLGGDPLYLDNIRFVEYPADALPPTVTGAVKKP